MFIAVDCGATNMRCRLFDGKVILDEIRREAGARNTAFEGTSAPLKAALVSSIKELLERNSLEEKEIEAILSSGVLASDMGIYQLPHARAPAGVAESAAAARLVVMEEITKIPILFIPGVKTLPDPDERDEDKKIFLRDSMSGEECETYGIMAQLGLSGNFIITLPGSYNKAIEVDGTGRIVSILTGMCGEFIAAISGHTILRYSLPRPVIRTIIPEKLTWGFDYCSRHGVSPSLIKARMVQTLGDWNCDEAANFFVGALLRDDILTAKETCRQETRDIKVIVGGGRPLRSIFVILLGHAGVENIVEVDDETARRAPAVGALCVYKEYLARHRG
ncbi:MAG: 2-dehydro-3-deoxygalactonokinase [Eubacteriales bacterium]|jgi:2-dehydro-3-deoxygalactonokinase